MFFRYDHESCRLIGRWAHGESAAVTTAPGSKLVFSFRGTGAVLHFDMDWCVPEYPHLWLSVDGGGRAEAQLSRYLRVEGIGEGEHTVTVLYKGGNENQHRWYAPLEAKIAFLGYEADAAGTLSYPEKPLLEVIGDSITEGVLVDEQYMPERLFWNNRPYQDDAAATYHALTAEALGWDEIVMGYGATGLTRTGSGSVPRAGLAYPWCYDGAPMVYDRHPDYVMINHGANDRPKPAEEYLLRYGELLDLVYRTHPDARVIALSAFVGGHRDALREFIPQYNAKTGRDVFFIDTQGWIPPEPLHPTREGHRTVAEHLIPILKEKYGL